VVFVVALLFLMMRLLVGWWADALLPGIEEPIDGAGVQMGAC
jgi:hypothetical protein